MICAAVRKKGSHDQCPSKAVFGHSLCGRHAKAKKVVLWADVHRKNVSIVNIQALIRGWLVRTRLKTAGPGVIDRRGVTNEDDLVTCQGKQEVHPDDYFAFTENGKVWWFVFPSLWSWAARSPRPVNPYTRTPLTEDTLKRMHDMWYLRWKQRRPIREPNQYEDRLRNRWNVICQLFANYGFGEIDPRHFYGYTKPQYAASIRMMIDDIQVAMPDIPKRRTIMRFLRYLQSVYRTPHYILHCTYIFMMMLFQFKDPYILAFTMLSAFYRI